MDWIVILCTVGNEEEGSLIARELVSRRLAACVNLVPGVRSFYHWQGEVRHDGEHLLVIKSARDKFLGIRECVRSLHSYELPELLCLDITGGDSEYLDWISSSLRGGDGQGEQQS